MSMDTPELFGEATAERYRFLLVIEPSAEANATVLEWKRLLRARIGGYSGSNSVPHITLFYADLPTACERDVREGVARGSTGLAAFPLHLHGITHFPDKKTIFIDPVEKESIAAVRKRIVANVRAFKRVRSIGLNVTDRPHLTIAAGLNPKQFAEAWAMLAPHTFSGEQQVAELLLLKRPLFREGRYEELERFPLNGQ